MRREELRGRKTSDFCVNRVVDFHRFYNHFESLEYLEERIFIEEELRIKLDKTTSLDTFKEKIIEDILDKYNANIHPMYILMYVYICWFKKCSKKILKLIDSNNVSKKEHLFQSMLDFEDIFTENIIKNRKKLLSEYDKKKPETIIFYEKLRLIDNIYNKVDVSSDEQAEQVFLQIKNTISNCIFLEIINPNNYKINNSFLLKWEHYPVSNLFQNVVDSFNSEISRTAYIDLKSNEKKYFDLLMKGECDFNVISKMKICKEGKHRNVYLTDDPFIQATLNYLSKRLQVEFSIKYPNRDKIMEVCFPLIDSLTELEDYTILKFDFENFFESVEIEYIYNKYIKHSDLYSYEKNLILLLNEKFKVCSQGLPTSNVLIEIISNDFDKMINSCFIREGLVFYRRYVDDCILIFNHRVEKEHILDQVNRLREMVFGSNVSLSSAKTFYQTKYCGDEGFDYLGYKFNKKYWDNDKSYYFEFGIAEKKIVKYKIQLDKIFAAYSDDTDECLLLRRLQYYDSRIVYYNYNGSKYVNNSSWDVRGIIENYKMLRRYIIYDSKNEKRIFRGGKKKVPARIGIETYQFLKHYVRNKRNELTNIPQYLIQKGCENHSLWHGFIHNKSIVFQPNIGWSNNFLNSRLSELGIATNRKSYYEKTRDYYNYLIKKL